ncbi:uncharacterized protein METZ01_LOCUS392701, partial [marine metagenome]
MVLRPFQTALGKRRRSLSSRSRRGGCLPSKDSAQ